MKIKDFKMLLKIYCIKQESVANVANCSQAAVSKWCNGKCEPSLNAIIKMSEVFQIPIEEIVLAFKKEDLSQEQTQLDGQVKFDYID